MQAICGWVGWAFLTALLVTSRALAEPPSQSEGGGKGAGPRFSPITCVELTVSNRVELDHLIRAGYDVATVKSTLVRLYVDSEELTRLRQHGWAPQVVPEASPVTEGRSLKSVAAYHDYPSMTAVLASFATNYPALCRRTSLGKSVLGRDLWALKITSDPDLALDKPKFRYVSTFHGNEPLGTELCLALAELLLKGYGSNDARLVRIVNQVETWLVPLANPDGRQNSPPMRYNASGYDLNRCFPEGSGGDFGNCLYGPPPATNGVPPEVCSLVNWSMSHRFVLGANLHTGSLVANYPYDNDGLGSVYSPSPDQSLFPILARAYAANNPSMWANTDPFNHFTNGIVNGAEWYSVTGGLQDWGYRYGGSMEITFELSDYGAHSGQWPDPAASLLPFFWGENRESMLSYLEWSLRGVRGVVRDAQTGQPVAAALRADGIHHLVFSDPAAGDYHRLLLPGVYTLWCYAPGYIPQRFPNVAVGSGDATRLDIALEPVSPRFAAKINFQPLSVVVPSGYLADSGVVFGSRAGGYRYGWESTLAAGTVLERKAARSQDLRYDTVCQMQSGGNHTWEIGLPNGPYSLLVAMGDPTASSGRYQVLAENNLVVDGTPSVADRWVEGLATVIVTDGRLTLSCGSAAAGSRLAFVELSAVEPVSILQWRALYFGTTNDASLAADDADPDGDGIPNLLEYAFALNPTNAELAAPWAPLVLPTNLAVWPAGQFVRNVRAADLAFYVQACNDLAAPVWTDVAWLTNGLSWTGPGQVVEQPDSLGRARVTVRDLSSLGGRTSRFLALRVRRL
jgi:hypothetical protein